jgi:uncharacterized SAM-binding protein YcdF (DUF218 family)
MNRTLRRTGGALLVLWLGGLFWFVTSLPAPRQTPPAATDGIVVLTGGAARIEAGLSLLRSDPKARLLISGVDPRISRETLQRFYAAGGRSFDCCVDLGRNAADTWGNAREIAAWAAKQEYGSLTVVTANYHMPRSLIEIGRAATGVALVPYPVISSNVPMERWWARPRTAALMISEYTKYLVSLSTAAIV